MATRHVRSNDVAGAVADLGVMVPLCAALILTNGLDGTAVFVAAGGLVIATGMYFGVPFPVQPLKALAAVAVARELSPGVIHAAGLEIAAFLLVLTIGGIADRIARIFTTPVVRALQVGVGALLITTAYRMLADPPAVFAGTPPSPWPFVLGAAALAGVWWAARTQRYALTLVLLVAGSGVVWWVAAPTVGAPDPRLPVLALPAAGDFAAAFVLLVIPQLPLTFGNAVVAVSDVAREYFGPRASRVTPMRVCLSCGIGNAVSGLIGGMPMCHGSGGLTAHVRLGARTATMNAGLGAVFVALGLFFAPQVTILLGLLPVWALAAFLAYAGLRHAWLVIDLRGPALALAAIGGVAGAVTGNLALTLGIALTVDHLVLRRVRIPA